MPTWFTLIICFPHVACASIAGSSNRRVLAFAVRNQSITRLNSLPLAHLPILLSLVHQFLGRVGLLWERERITKLILSPTDKFANSLLRCCPGGASCGAQNLHDMQVTFTAPSTKCTYHVKCCQQRGTLLACLIALPPLQSLCHQSSCPFSNL